jgi:crotonobetainyl-CoA:carnitine CoA-transferase CaiB-like acyl-CoA transferase
MLPLDGVTVVTLEQAVAAPFATRQLADMGARVIKIERPAVGDFARSYDHAVKGLSSHFVWLNRSKESLTLDLKRPEAQDVLSKLIERADVFVQNLAPGAAERLGLGVSRLRERYPSLIACGISGYGSTGPYRDKKAYDLLVQAESGLISINGSKDEPAKVAISIADISAGMYALTNILTALFARTRSGAGTSIDVSMLEALGEWMGFPLYYATYGGSSPPRVGARHAAIAPYGPFPTGGGDVVYLGIQNEREWVLFCKEVLERPEVATDVRFDSNPKRVENLQALHDVIGAVFKELPASEVVSRLERGRIAHGDLNTVQQFADHPQLAARDRWREVDSPAGPLKALLPPGLVEGVEARMDPIPSVGEHTDAILTELGYDAPTVAAWRSAGVV